ncbi:hypothetical protein [Pseudomonas abietaniphila]|uniref:Uncharacterized protein n=1 Tax=Pseudomonas abietaniphila TaxID=89065 RepID=A0A1G8K9W1_9PSED|nr:hypothetical protein [Pseudomonas abietaniphila]SDI40266.1 hypothetical protein SAMN05216605_11325 [Pseudomonas abietaniphila]
MAISTITFTIKWAWWVIPYLQAVTWFSEWTGLDPDVDKVVATAMRGLRLELD